MMIYVSVASTTRFSERLRHFIRQFMNEYWSLPKICNFKLSYSFLLNAWCLFFISPVKKIVMHTYDQAGMHWSFPVHLFLALFQHLILRKLLKIVTAKPYLYWSYFLDGNDEYSFALHSKWIVFTFARAMHFKFDYGYELKGFLLFMNLVILEHWVGFLLLNSYLMARSLW